MARDDDTLIGIGILLKYVIAFKFNIKFWKDFYISFKAN